MRHLRALVLAALIAGLLVPAVGHATSSLAVALDPPIVGATPTTVTFTMVSDDPAVRYAVGFARADDGRPCEPSVVAFQGANRGYVSLGEGVRFRPGATSQQVSPLKQAGPLRVCGYLYGTDPAKSLAVSDTVVPVRLPTGTATLTVDPPRPTYGRPVTLRVTGSVEIPASVEVLGGVKACAGAETVTPDARMLQPGPFDVTFTGVDLPDGVTHLCVRVTPQTLLDPPNEGLVLAAVDQPLAVDLGASLGAPRVRVTGRRVEVSAPVSGRFDGPLELRVDGAVCEGNPDAKVAGGRAVAQCFLVHDPRVSRARVGLSGRTRFGAQLQTAPLTADLRAFQRTGRLVVPGRSIGVVRLGMSLADLLRQGAQAGGGIFTSPKVVMQFTVRDRVYEVDRVAAVVRGGRVRAIFTRGNETSRDDYRTAAGLTTRSSPLRSSLRRLARGASCRPLKGHPEASDLCRLGPATWWGPGGGGAITEGFFAIWPGSSVRPGR